MGELYASEKETNPFFSPYNTVFDTPTFDIIKLEHYMPAFESGIAQARENIDKIISNPEPASFKNTIEALENSQLLLNRTASVFYNLRHCATSPQMDELAERLQPMMSELSSDISLNADLFAKIKTVYEQRDSLGLSTEQMTLLKDTYKGFERGGANLSDSDKQLRRDKSSELGSLTLKFSQNVLAANNAFTIDIPASEEDKIAELPDFLKSTLAQNAKEKGLEGWTITLQFPSYFPFMTYSSNREIKQTLWHKYSSRANENNDNDNKEIIRRITELRLDIAKLHGYQTYADYAIENRMAETAQNVNDFLDQLLSASKEYAVKDFDDVKNFALEQGFEGEFSPWDFNYWSEKYKMARYALNDELIMPYLRLENATKAVFMLAEKMYGLRFVANKTIQVYDPEVEAYEVYDKNNRFMAVLYMDFFPRENKSSGAWMTSFRELETSPEGKQIRPLVSVCTNFSKPTEDNPSLLTFNEFTTLLHEFGHALHGILAEGTYTSTTGTNVYQDFVELPSQLMENWATEKEFLDLWAVHYKTGERMPEELIKKIIDSKNFLAGYANLRQLTFGMLDMAWHSITSPIEGSMSDFEREAVANTQIFFPYSEGTSISTAFSHIFAGGYSAGYYSYKWAEVLEADAFSLFQQEGILNPEVAERFRSTLLSKGGTEHPMKLYIDFRGHKPEVGALLEKMGFVR